MFHRNGLLYQRRFDPRLHDDARYDLKLGYPSSHSWALAAVPEGAAVMVFGAGPGELAGELVRKGCTVRVVDRGATGDAGEVAPVARHPDDPPPFDVRPYHYFLLLDTIEHLPDPERFVDQLRTQFDYTTRVVILTTPNIAFFVQRIMLLFGQFNYGRAGILDRTHTRLYTFRGIRHLLRDAGFRVRRVRGVPVPFPLVFGDGVPARLALALNRVLIAISKTLFAYQIYVEAETTPDVDFLLQDAKRKDPGRSRCLTDGSEHSRP